MNEAYGFQYRSLSSLLFVVACSVFSMAHATSISSKPVSHSLNTSTAESNRLLTLAAADSATQHFERARNLAKRGKLVEAIAQYGKAIALRPASWEAYSNRADLYGKLKRHDQAIADLDKVVELAPNNERGLAHPGTQLAV